MTEPRTLYYNSQSEADFDESLFGLSPRHPGLAWQFGWDPELCYHTHDSRRSTEGFPDRVLVHPTAHRLLVVELKRELERPSPAQVRWLEALRQCDRPEVYLWRPSMIEQITRILRGNGLA